MIQLVSKMTVVHHMSCPWQPLFGLTRPILGYPSPLPAGCCLSGNMLHCSKIGQRVPYDHKQGVLRGFASCLEQINHIIHKAANRFLKSLSALVPLSLGDRLIYQCWYFDRGLEIINWIRIFISKNRFSILPVNQKEPLLSSCLHLHKHKVHCDTDMFIDDENNEGSDENINYFSDDS